ncbi:hypothetical protein [Mycobacteroides franklinii]|uniref:Uncharacterized protein n=1 Tax=Mycobacteroides franklinii TaxID=948102 RepID=A0A4R8QZV3_9MYCO|nr:hypothetical protein [Mycobacteroides franklinii]TDZ45866.1 hypothetical protein CCUG64054_01516 [Mycobacteroides franklinii]TDZ49356.1 hypothetical protein CCUG63697_03892 [Mycobacteroides franklinii]TDZ59536.1 hypothetical protein CCUG63696_01518 [Mycobacteroides franklinii]TDZ67051.1 hypothetical protein CCUG63695_00881 [Mycobacteroides franklinii]TDZ72975.1 hypothetical protein CCUG64056_01516 [Mycobacteroides franklinii]
MIRVLSVAVVLTGLVAGFAAPASAELPPPGPAPYGPVVAPGQLPALNVSRGTRLPSSMSGARGPRMSGGMEGGAGASGGVKASGGFGD